MALYFPIKDITTYTSNWTVLGRVVSKAPLKQIKGDNYVMTVDIVDKDGDLIRCKFWGKAAQKWNEVLLPDNVYKFSKGNVTLANRKFNNTNHNYELVFNQDSQIELAEDAVDISSERKYKFVSLRDVKSSAAETPFTVDVLCIVRFVGPETTITTRTGKEIAKRILNLVDDSSYELELTLWDPYTKLEFLDTAESKPIIASQIMIRDWQGGRSAQSTATSVIKLVDQNTFRDKARLLDLVSWFEQAHSQADGFKSMKQLQRTFSHETIQTTTITNVAGKTKGTFEFNCKLRRVYWRHKDGGLRLWYSACPMCTKKVVHDDTNASYRCFTCDDAVVVPVNRYLFTCCFIDHTGQIVGNVYGDYGDKLFDKTAVELSSMDVEDIKRVMDYEVLLKDFKITGVIKSRTYNGELRYNFNVTGVQPIDYPSETAAMLDEMEIEYSRVEVFLGITSKNESHKRRKISATRTIDDDFD